MAYKLSLYWQKAKIKIHKQNPSFNCESQDFLWDRSKCFHVYIQYSVTKTLKTCTLNCFFMNIFIFIIPALLQFYAETLGKLGFLVFCSSCFKSWTSSVFQNESKCLKIWMIKWNETNNLTWYATKSQLFFLMLVIFKVHL